LEGAEVFVAEGGLGALIFLGELGQEQIGEGWDFAASIPERRQVDGEDVEAIEQVLPETAGGNFVG
jgi:hypothetical protein